MGREVAQRAYRLKLELGCEACGIGKAIDVVGRAWGEPPYDWAGIEAKRAGQHICKNTTWNLHEKPTRRIAPHEWGFGRVTSAFKYDASEGIVATDEEKNAAVLQATVDLARWRERQREAEEQTLPDDSDVPF